MADKQWETCPSGKSTGAASKEGVQRIYLILAYLTATWILSIALFAILTTASGRSPFTPNDEGLLPVGSTVQDFTAQSIDGKEASLKETGGKDAMMLLFFASWCWQCEHQVL